MKRFLLLSVLFGALPLLSMAQDDLYFTPSKAEQSAYQQNKIEEDSPAYYSGIGKSNDEYNRRGKYNYKKIGVDSLGNDIFMSRISTLHGDSVVLDTIYGGFTRKYESGEDDFAYSRRMSRFDGFYGGYYDPWFAGRSSIYVGWGWRSPYYGGWYDRWDDPWYYGYYGGYPYYGYYSGYPYYGYYGGYPYYYGYAGYGWYNPWSRYYGGYPYYGYRRGGYYAYNGHTGTANHWGDSPRAFDSQTRSSYYNNERSSYSTRRGNQYGNNASPRNDMNGYYDRFGGARQRSVESQTRQVYSQPERSTFSQPSPSSFGGARSGDGNFGGSYSGGGGSGSSRFGGHR